MESWVFSQPRCHESSNPGIRYVYEFKGLLSAEKVAELKASRDPKLYLYPWHFFKEHRALEDGQWKFVLGDKDTKYYDMEGQHPYDFPPPKNVPENFVNEEYFVTYATKPRDRWVEENRESKMPRWMLNMLAIDDGASSEQTSNEKETISSVLRRMEMYRARAHFLQEERKEQEESHSTELSGMKRKFEEMNNTTKQQQTTISEHEKSIHEITRERDDLKSKLAAEKLKQCHEKKASPLRYSDLYHGGILSNHVSSFSLFDTVEQNDAFLDLINYADGSPGSFPEGDGLCQNLRSYSHVKMDERKKEVDPPPAMEPDSEEYRRWLSRSRAARKGATTMDWKDEYLAFCVYVRAGNTQKFVAALFDISEGYMSDIFHGRAQILDQALREMFPCPTRKQMYQAYPQRFVEADGHAMCFMLLDAFEIFTQSSSNPNVASALHSDYKKHATAKFLGATDPIGCAWDQSVSDAYPGKASDVFATQDSEILKQVPYGHKTKVDKGFICDNIAIECGNHLDRPQKRLKGQVQQSSVDTSQTQKIGNTRIIVENVNGELKLHFRLLNVLIPTLQFGVISKIVRIGYLLQNLKKPIVQDKGPSSDKPKLGVPCRGEVRWYGLETGATAAGLVDVRDSVHLWGYTCEKKLYRELLAMPEHKNTSALELGNKVLDEKLEEVKLKEFNEQIHGIVSDD